MDDMTAFERQIAVELSRMAGPGRRIDAMAMVHAVATRTSREPAITRGIRARVSPFPQGRGITVFSAIKFVTAGAVVALFGSLLLLAAPPGDQEQPAPAAVTASAAPTYVPPVPVTGTMNTDAEGIDWGPADDVSQEFDRKTERGGGRTQVFEMDDPRLSGVAYQLSNLDQIGPKYEYHEGETFTGTIELVNDDGSWVGSLRGYATMGPATRHWHFELTGTGAYEGLSAILEGVGPYGSAEVQGLIFPGSLPEYPDPVEVPAE